MQNHSTRIIDRVHNTRGQRENDKLNITHMKAINFGSFLIDGALFRVKDPKTRKWLKDFLSRYSDEIEIRVLIRTNPYKTLQILWSEYFRIALKGHPLKKFLELIDKLEDITCTKEDERFLERGIRVIPLAPAWLPKNRVLLDLILEYLSGKIDENMAKRVFYSAFLRIFKRKDFFMIPQTLS